MTQIEAKADLTRIEQALAAAPDLTTEDVRQLMDAYREKQQSTNTASAALTKQNFLNNLSHDIRTPMNAVIGYTALAARDIHDSAQVGTYLEKIKTSSTCLLHLIDNILDMNRIQAGQVSLDSRPVDLVSLAEGVIVICQSQCDDKSVALALDVSRVCDRLVLCDELRLSQILLNLLSNAAQFTPAGGHVCLTVTQQECKSGQENRTYTFSVRDDGIGMHSDFQPHVYEPFTRERNSTDCGVPGAGLGLSITKGLVDKMGGTIAINSQPDQGTEVIITLTLPIADSLCGSEEGTAPGEVTAAGRRILLVEDNDMNREIACELLSDQGCQVMTAGNGAEALELVRHTQPGRMDAILMDIQMPVMDGYEATRAIRSLPDPAQASIPIIALTANSLETDETTAIEAGMDAYLTKPLNVAKLIQTLTAIL